MYELKIVKKLIDDQLFIQNQVIADTMHLPLHIYIHMRTRIFIYIRIYVYK